nr:YggS family pyridoxal phosphate-dependent enzyme [uncultured Sphingomonas sp.]
MSDPRAHLNDIRERMTKAARAAKREPADTQLIAVTKKRPVEDIESLIAAGVTDFGENRVAEAQEKWAALRQQHPEIRLHMIGQLQSNKAADAVALFDVIHSVDRESLLDALAAESVRQGRAPEIYVQVNIGDEPQKGGVAIADLPAFLEKVRASPLRLKGLMAMPPQTWSAVPYFALLAKLARRHDVDGLSMGMSGDFEEAVMQGATAVRIGSALFDD